MLCTVVHMYQCWYLSITLHGNIYQKTIILFITVFTRAHPWSLLKPTPVYTLPFSFLMPYPTAIIFLTGKIYWYFCQTLCPIWQLPASDFMPWLPFMSAAPLLPNYTDKHNNSTIYLIPRWWMMFTADPLPHTGGHQCPLQTLHLMARLSAMSTTDPLLLSMTVTGICSVMFEYVFTPVSCSI